MPETESALACTLGAVLLQKADIVKRGAIYLFPFWENYSDERSTELGGDGAALVEFVAAIRQNREPVAGIADAVGSMRLYQAIWDAYAEGRDGMLPLPD